MTRSLFAVALPTYFDKVHDVTWVGREDLAVVFGLSCAVYCKTSKQASGTHDSQSLELQLKSCWNPSQAYMHTQVLQRRQRGANLAKGCRGVKTNLSNSHDSQMRESPLQQSMNPPRADMHPQTLRDDNVG